MPRFRARDYVTNDDFQIVGCAACGLTRTHPQPDPSALGAYYPPQYYGRVGARRFPALVEAGQRVLYAARARALGRMAGIDAGRVVDIGCGPGLLLQAFRRRGWSVQGTELSEASAARARDAGVPVHVGPLESWDWPDGAFDAVALWHVLEHWPEPGPVLRRVYRLLRPGGALLVGVPNFGSPEARMARDGWFHLDVPRHLVHFTEDSLGSALSSAGFTIGRRSFLAPEFDVFSFVQSALNALGLRQNLLYSVLRGRGAKILDPDKKWQIPLSLLLAGILGVVALPVTTLLGLLGQGSSLTMYAIKPDARPSDGGGVGPGPARPRIGG